jgi:hypothetical protein
LSLSQSIRIPATVLTNISEQILNPTETFSPLLIILQYAFVIGKHHAKGMGQSKKPI